jgi:hypothetical protein
MLTAMPGASMLTPASEQHIMAGTANPDTAIRSAALNTSSSPLLRLPGELRNRIYAYALTAGGGLDLVWTRDRPSPQLLASEVTEDNACDDWNQLKYICHQLYNETAGLEADFNLVTVRNLRVTVHNRHITVRNRPSDQGPVELFSEFLDTCDPNKVACFTNVDLVHYPPDAKISNLVEPPKWLLPIADFCRPHPRVNIRYMPPPFGSYQHPVTFIRKGSYLSGVFRHQDVISRLIPTHTFDWGLRQDAWVQDPSSVSLVTLPNLRIFPNKDGFDEQVFRNIIQVYRTSKRAVA